MSDTVVSLPFFFGGPQFLLFPPPLCGSQESDIGPGRPFFFSESKRDNICQRYSVFFFPFLPRLSRDLCQGLPFSGRHRRRRYFSSPPPPLFFFLTKEMSPFFSLQPQSRNRARVGILRLFFLSFTKSSQKVLCFPPPFFLESATRAIGQLAHEPLLSPPFPPSLTVLYTEAFDPRLPVAMDTGVAKTA